MEKKVDIFLHYFFTFKVNKTADDTGLALKGVTFAIYKVPVPSVNYDPNVTYGAGDLDDYLLDANGDPITAVTNASDR